MTADHDCLEQELVYRTHEWREPHGEPCYQEWWECPICGETFTGAELDKIVGQQ